MQEGQAPIGVRAEQAEKEANLLRAVVRQAWFEHWVLLKKKVNFRKRSNEQATAAYCAMQIEEFEAINARQRWANWRTIAKNLKGKLPEHPLVAIDLCCGIGNSTEVLAYYLPLESRILGLEFNPEFVRSAKERSYMNSRGSPCEVSFRAQSVLETFLDAQGKEVAPFSVDLVNCCGAVGCHFEPSSTERLADEVTRVLKPGGLAMIDSGLPGTSKRVLIGIFEKRGFRVLGSAKSCFLDLYTQVCFKKD